jgi:hypothetical protein
MGDRCVKPQNTLLDLRQCIKRGLASRWHQLAPWPNHVTRDIPHRLSNTVHHSTEPMLTTTTPGKSVPQQWEDRKLTHQQGLDKYITSNNLDNVIKQQMIKAITDPIFLKSLENHISGFYRIIKRAMIQ